MSVNCIITGQSTGSSPVIQSISIITPPAKTQYYHNEIFDKTGMVVMASFVLDGVFSQANVTGSVTVSPETLTIGTTQVTISYIDNSGNIATATQKVSVLNYFVLAECITLPNKTDYEYDDVFNDDGILFELTYASGHKTTSNKPFGYYPLKFKTVGTQEMWASFKNGKYNNDSDFIRAYFSVNVSRKTVPIPTWKSNLTYNGNLQSVNETTFWNNYNTDYMTMSGDVSGTNAGTYTATFTPKDNYRWPDGSITGKEVTWTIDKKSYTLGISTETVSIDSSNYETGVQVIVTREGTGAITATVDKTGVTATVSGTTITVKGDGSTAGNFYITISVAADMNHNASLSRTVSVSAIYFSFPFEDKSNGDATFWENLTGALSLSTAAEREACIGRTVWVELNEPVLGTTGHYVRCIGYDCDGDKTLTFQTMNCLEQSISFGPSPIYEPMEDAGESIASMCWDFFFGFPGLDWIRPVLKNYCQAGGGGHYDLPYDTIFEEDVFLPSCAEYGYIVLSSDMYARPSSFEEFSYEGDGSTPYQFFVIGTQRRKFYGSNYDPTEPPVGIDYTSATYWTKSRDADNSKAVCIIDESGDLYTELIGTTTGFAPAFVI